MLFYFSSSPFTSSFLHPTSSFSPVHFWSHPSFSIKSESFTFFKPLIPSLLHLPSFTLFLLSSLIFLFLPCPYSLYPSLSFFLPPLSCHSLFQPHLSMVTRCFADGFLSQPSCYWPRPAVKILAPPMSKSITPQWVGFWGKLPPEAENQRLWINHCRQGRAKHCGPSSIFKIEMEREWEGVGDRKEWAGNEKKWGWTEAK